MAEKTDDEKLCETIILASLRLASANTPQDYAHAVARVTDLARALWSHRL